MYEQCVFCNLRKKRHEVQNNSEWFKPAIVNMESGIDSLLSDLTDDSNVEWLNAGISMRATMGNKR